MLSEHAVVRRFDQLSTTCLPNLCSRVHLRSSSCDHRLSRPTLTQHLPFGAQPCDMGNCFSDPSTKKKKDSANAGNVLGSAPGRPAQATTGAARQSAPTELAPVTATSRPGQMLGDGFEDSNRSKDPREMARIAAEERIKSVSMSASTGHFATRTITICAL